MNVIVVGGGPAGISAAVHAHRLGADVTLLERERLGGVCYNEGPVPVRTLARAARMVRDAGAWGDFGLVGAPPHVVLGRALANVTRTVDHIYEVKHAAEQLRDEGIDVAERIGPVRFIDPSTVAVADGRLFHGDRIILAVGGHDRRLPLPGADLGLSYRAIMHLDALPKSIVVIGGADTGCKLASIFGAFGCHVTVVELAPRLIPRADADLGEALGRAFASRGMDIRTGCRTERLERVGSGIEVHLSSDAPATRATTVKSDAVFVAVGWPGNIEELGLDVAGIETARGYIRVDSQLRTSQPHVFAIGDVNGLCKLVEPAIRQGYVATENAVLGAGRAYAAGITPVGGFTDPEYASVGMTEAEARARGDCVVGRHDHGRLTRAVVDGRVDGFCKLIAARDSGILLGAHILGEYSAELIQVVAVCMAANMTVRQIAELQLAYPTFTQAIGVIALRLAHELELVPNSAEFESAELLDASP
jgi:pyruvate/2-oxoglutarate dehydrogenase complex dihydrolipoamide dehydrogenase (E3) component